MNSLEQFLGVVLEPRGVFLGGANFSRLPSRLDPVTLFSVGSFQRPKSFLLNSSRFAKKQNSLSGAGRRACARQQPGRRDLGEQQSGEEPAFGSQGSGASQACSPSQGRLLPWGREHRHSIACFPASSAESGVNAL